MFAPWPNERYGCCDNHVLGNDMCRAELLFQLPVTTNHHDSETHRLRRRYEVLRFAIHRSPIAEPGNAIENERRQYHDRTFFKVGYILLLRLCQPRIGEPSLESDRPSDSSRTNFAHQQLHQASPRVEPPGFPIVLNRIVEFDSQKSRGTNGSGRSNSRCDGISAGDRCRNRQAPQPRRIRSSDLGP